MAAVAVMVSVFVPGVPATETPEPPRILMFSAVSGGTGPPVSPVRVPMESDLSLDIWLIDSSGVKDLQSR